MVSLAALGPGAYIISGVLGASYILVMLVALFHPDSARRKNATAILKLHRLSRKPIGRSKSLLEKSRLNRGTKEKPHK